MNTKLIPILLVVAGSLMLPGCCTPSAVKNLAQETRIATAHMGEVHEQDLRTLAAYDRARVVEFYALLDNYFTLRSDVLNAFNEVLERSKQAAIIQLDNEFNQQAEQIIAVRFWSGIRQEADKQLNPLADQCKEKMAATTADANAFKYDRDAINRSLLATRNYYKMASDRYDTVESSFAELILKIDQARSDFRTNNEKLFAGIKPLKMPDLPAEVTNFTFTNNSAEIDQRISNLTDAYAKLDSAHATMEQYLDDNNLGVTFVTSLVQATLGLSAASNDTTNTPVSATPSDSIAGQLPGLGGLFSSLQSKLDQVKTATGTGGGSLGQIMTQLVSQTQSIVKVIPNPDTPTAGTTAQASNPATSP